MTKPELSCLIFVSKLLGASPGRGLCLSKTHLPAKLSAFSLAPAALTIVKPIVNKSVTDLDSLKRCHLSYRMHWTANNYIIVGFRTSSPNRNPAFGILRSFHLCC